MVNDILYKRLCKLIAITYALDEMIVWRAYSKLNSIDKLLECIRNGRITEIISETKR